MVRFKEIESEVVEYFKELRKVQLEYADTENVCYPIISLYCAAKEKIFFKNLLLHPLVLGVNPFYETRVQLSKLELEQLLERVIVYELTEQNECLTTKERDTIIKAHKRLKKRNGRPIATV